MTKKNSEIKDNAVQVVLFDFAINDAVTAFSIEDAILNDDDFANKVAVFTWRTKPTIMIGRFQNPYTETNFELLQAKNVNLVRRATGGGTIYTDDGCFQFSIIAQRVKPDGTYQKNIDFMRFLKPSQETFVQMGIDCEISSRNDLLYNGIKFNGNAQHASKNRIIYHGSVLYNTDLSEMDTLLTPSKVKLLSKGIKSTRQRVINLQEVDTVTRDISEFQSTFEMLLAEKIAVIYNEDNNRNGRLLSFVSDMELQKPDLFKQAKIIAKEKYGNDKWNLQKTPPYTVKKEKMLSAGLVSFTANVVHEIIKSVHIEGDFFSADEDFEAKLADFVGKEFNKNALEPVIDQFCSGETFRLSKDEFISLIFD